jgi:ribosomal protein L11 methyltransferase
MQYHTLTFYCTSDLIEILTAELAEAGFDSFLETDEGFITYSEKEIQEVDLTYIVEKYKLLGEISYEISSTEKKNWNEEWEKNYEPVVIENTCLIRTPFHVVEQTYPIELLIVPKMSFGTGHHQTTYLMIKAMIGFDFHHKSVLDVGTGTGVLAIFAALRGAKKIDALDVDEWSKENAEENAILNDTSQISFYSGTIADLQLSEKYDFVLANINRNIILEELSSYLRLLKDNGRLILSGFYQWDIPILSAASKKAGLKMELEDQKSDWCCLIYRFE